MYVCMYVCVCIYIYIYIYIYIKAEREAARAKAFAKKVEELGAAKLREEREAAREEITILN